MLSQLNTVLYNPEARLTGLGRSAHVLLHRKVESPESVADPRQPFKKEGPDGLSSAEEDLVRELQQRDQEVRNHEQRHHAAAGSLASGGPQYEYVIGPDGKPYAVAGEVHVDTSVDSGSPEKTRQKARQIQNAALAVGDPSSADMAVAAGARQMEVQAGNQLRENSALPVPGSHLFSDISKSTGGTEPGGQINEYA
ncbi:MAG: hypothetical protein KDK34_15855 [Leptospiraceae bacterium]|nr:hypothetical protein [Leptospiraceae bacterium]